MELNFIDKLELVVDKNKIELKELNAVCQELKDLMSREDTIVEVIEKAPYYESYYCPVCGDYVEPNNTYCPSCGSKMGWGIFW